MSGTAARALTHGAARRAAPAIANVPPTHAELAKGLHAAAREPMQQLSTSKRKKRLPDVSFDRKFQRFEISERCDDLAVMQLLYMMS